MNSNIPKPTWSIVATVKEDREKIKDFIAHYKSIGADQIYIFFDDPDDPSFGIAEATEGVIAKLCTNDFWGGARPPRHETRQTQNARRAYIRCNTDWIIHLDADEYLYCPNGVANLLARSSETEMALRVVPAEPFIHPKTGAIKAYRSPLPGNMQGMRIGKLAFGEIYPLLAGGLLSHAAGKYLVRTRLPKAPLTIHRPKLPKEIPIRDLSREDILLLHHHGADEDEWLEKFKFRLENTYSKQFHDNKPRAKKIDGKGLNAYLNNIYDEQGETGLRNLYRRIYYLRHDKSRLRRVGAIHRPQLWLEQKKTDRFSSVKTICSDYRIDRMTGRLQAVAEFLNIKMVIEPDFNYTEGMLASGIIPEEAELQCILDIVAGKAVNFWDVGANTGIYSLIVAAHAKKNSVIHAFEPHPLMLTALKRNLAHNEFKNIRIEPVALGDEYGETFLYSQSNLGQSTLIATEGSDAIQVKMNTLQSYVSKCDPSLLSVLKIDVEGAEPLVLKGFFEKADTLHFPNYILYEHAHSESWSIPKELLFPQELYETKAVFQHNTLLKKIGA